MKSSLLSVFIFCQSVYIVKIFTIDRFHPSARVDPLAVCLWPLARSCCSGPRGRPGGTADGDWDWGCVVVLFSNANISHSPEVKVGITLNLRNCFSSGPTGPDTVPARSFRTHPARSVPNPRACQRTGISERNQEFSQLFGFENVGRVSLQLNGCCAGMFRMGRISSGKLFIFLFFNSTG